MQRVIFLMDFPNIDRAARNQGMALDYGDVIDYLSEGRYLQHAVAFVPVDPRAPNRADTDIHHLREAGYFVRTKQGTIAGDTFRCNMDVDLALDAIQLAINLNPDTVIIGSGDADFLPVVDTLRQRGIRVEVAAFRAAAAQVMREHASGFVDLDVYVAAAEAESDGAATGEDDALIYDEIDPAQEIEEDLEDGMAALSGEEAELVPDGGDYHSASPVRPASAERPF